MKRRMLCAWMALWVGIPVWAAGPQTSTAEFDGPTSLAIVLANFADAPVADRFTQADRDLIELYVFGDGSGTSVNELFDEMSFGLDTLDGAIVAEVDLPFDGHDESVDCFDDVGVSGIRTWHDWAVANAGLDLSVGNPSGYGQVMVIFNENNICDNADGGINGYEYSGSPQAGRLPATSILNWRRPQTIAHEVGHLKGWQHAGLAGDETAYGDHSCVMGDNYIYHGHPEYYEYAAPGETVAKVVPMRHANAAWKLASGYISESDVLDVSAGPASETVFLAPTQQPPADFPSHPQQQPLHHAATISLENFDQEFIVSYRRPSLSAFDGHPALDHLMGRIHVHSYFADGGTYTWREANMEAGDNFEYGPIVVTAITDGLADEAYVEARIDVDALYPARIDIAEEIHQANASGADSAPIPVTIFHRGPSGTVAADFDLGVVSSDPRIAGATFSPPTVHLQPNESATVQLTLHFTGALPEGSIPFEVTASDPAGSRKVGEAESSFVNDTIPPQIGNLDGEHRIDHVVLTWTFETYTDVYTIERNGSATTLPPHSTSFTDGDAIVPGGEYTYLVTATDLAGNVTQETIVVADECIAGFQVQIAPMNFELAEEQPETVFDVAEYLVTIDNPNPPACGDLAYQIDLSGSLPANYQFDDADVTVPSGSSASAMIALDHLVFPPTGGSLSETMFDFDVEVTEPNGDSLIVAGVWFTYDLTAPGPVPGLSGTQNTASVSLSWSAAQDELSGVTGYRVVRDGDYLGITSALSFTDVNVPPVRPLSYTVRAIDAVGNLGPPSTFTFTEFPPCPKCPTPQP